MQAVILAGGEGKRVRPLTKSRPKAMIPVANRPIIEYSIIALKKAGIRDIVVVVGYRREQVTRFLNTIDPSIKVVVQEKQLGTAYALQCAEPFIEGDFLLLPGDNYIDPVSISNISKCKNAMLFWEHSSPSNFGVVVLHEGYVTDIIEKPEHSPSHLVSTGIFSLTKDFFSHINSNELPDVIISRIASGEKLQAIEAEDWQDALYPWDLLKLNQRLLRGISPEKNGNIHKSAVFRGLVHIETGASIGPYTMINGPAVIGKDTVIGPHCVIQPNTSIGSRARIEPFSFIGNSLVMDDVSIGSHSRIHDAVIGEGTELADHSVTRLVEGCLEIEGQVIKTRFGAVIGDQVTVNPFCAIQGSIVGNGVKILGENRNIRGMAIPDDALVI